MPAAARAIRARKAPYTPGAQVKGQVLFFLPTTDAGALHFIQYMRRWFTVVDVFSDEVTMIELVSKKYDREIFQFADDLIDNIPIGRLQHPTELDVMRSLAVRVMPDGRKIDPQAGKAEKITLVTIVWLKRAIEKYEHLPKIRVKIIPDAHPRAPANVLFARRVLDQQMHVPLPLVPEQFGGPPHYPRNANTGIFPLHHVEPARVQWAGRARDFVAIAPAEDFENAIASGSGTTHDDTDTGHANDHSIVAATFPLSASAAAPGRDRRPRVSACSFAPGTGAAHARSPFPDLLGEALGGMSSRSSDAD